MQIVLSELDKEILTEIRKHKSGIDIISISNNTNKEIREIKPAMNSLLEHHFIGTGMKRRSWGFERLYYYHEGLENKVEA